MPARPPKKWFRDCEKGVAKGGGARDPARVCGAVWSRKTSTEKKRAARKEERTMKHRRAKHCRTCTKGGKFSKRGRYYRCKVGSHWTKPRKRSKR